jgi:hypothetical protein
MAAADTVAHVSGGDAEDEDASAEAGEAEALSLPAESGARAGLATEAPPSHPLMNAELAGLEGFLVDGVFDAAAAALPLALEVAADRALRGLADCLRALLGRERLLRLAGAELDDDNASKSESLPCPRSCAAASSAST